MKNTVVVVTDLGSFKAYRLEKTPVKQTPRLELIEQFTPAEAHTKLTDKVTDSAGRYRVPGAAGGTSFGDRGKLDLEIRKRLLRQMAERLAHLLRATEIEECHLAASKEIANQLLDCLDEPSRRKVAKVVAADLTRVDKSELLNHF